MGDDGSDWTTGYINTNERAHFKLLTREGEMIDLHGNTSAFENLGIFNIALSSGVIPENLVLERAYPNPFNPLTTLKFGLPASDYIKLVIYDINGRVVDTLIDGML